MSASRGWSELVRGTNGLTFDVYEALRTESPAKNLMASPISISMALAMAYAGARGTTREEMRESLRYTLDDDRLHAAFKGIREELVGRGGDSGAGRPPSVDGEGEPGAFRLALGNAVWGQAGYPFCEGFRAALEGYYDGGFRTVDFRGEPAAVRGEINTWVADRTEGRIKDLIPAGALDEDTRLVLTNAVYFLAHWQTPFPKSDTSLEEFTGLDGTTAEVAIMHRFDQFRYAEVDGVQVVDLPYVGREVSMLVILPPIGEFTGYEETFDAAALGRLVDAMDFREGHVGLPRFEFDSRFGLRDCLEALGMSAAFDESNADFTGMAHIEQTEANLYLHDVVHGCYLAVDERKTEAAAATPTTMEVTAPPPDPDPFEFVADRPFLFAIRHASTGAVLFFGRVVDGDAVQVEIDT